MVEGEAVEEGVLDLDPVGAVGVAAADRGREVRGHGEERGGDDPATRIAVGIGVGPELAQRKRGRVEAGFLLQFDAGGGLEGFTRAQKAAGQGELAAERFGAAHDEQDLELVVPHGQHDQVHGVLHRGAEGIAGRRRHQTPASRVCTVFMSSSTEQRETSIGRSSGSSEK
ncbi:hypothetical protein BBK82_15200 [Lentzea guizhouensis]|uniref:Uncharacterized protein n=1 Tax=Lentzea guizhouensis TaxID=1586287 RepID=A0A1B2HHN0_9PSEU|nr:hypothetical protein BBK82_15200 [Lentzea guizhouensis]